MQNLSNKKRSYLSDYQSNYYQPTNYYKVKYAILKKQNDILINQINGITRYQLNKDDFKREYQKVQENNDKCTLVNCKSQKRHKI